MDAAIFIILIGLLLAFPVGRLARWAVPGPNPMPLWLTLLVGVPGVLLTPLASVLLVVAYRRLYQRRPLTGLDARVAPTRGFGVARYRARLTRELEEAERLSSAQPTDLRVRSPLAVALGAHAAMLPIWAFWGVVAAWSASSASGFLVAAGLWLYLGVKTVRWWREERSDLWRAPVLLPLVPLLAVLPPGLLLLLWPTFRRQLLPRETLAGKAARLRVELGQAAATPASELVRAA